MNREEKIQRLAKELSRMFYFGWMNGHNDLAASVGRDKANPQLVLAKAESEVHTFLDTAKEIMDKLDV